LSRGEWEKILREEEGCEPVATGEARRIQTAEWWKTEHNRLFTVPIDPDGRLSQFDLTKVRIEIASLKPLDWDS